MWGTTVPAPHPWLQPATAFPPASVRFALTAASDRNIHLAGPGKNLGGSDRGLSGADPCVLGDWQSVRVQPIDATASANARDGDIPPRVRRGRSLSSLATASRCAWE